MFASQLPLECQLSADLIHADGSVEHLGVLYRTSPLRRLYNFLRRGGWIPLTLAFAAFVDLYSCNHGRGLRDDVQFALVTTAGANYMAADFLAASTAHINAFKYHDCGTGTTAELVAQTALITPAGVTRVSGTDTNPSANIYQSVATISFTSTLAITEWGLFSAASSGTMWDRRLFSAINVVNSDSIQFTYALTVPSGGS